MRRPLLGHGSAVDEAIAVQSALLSEPWPEGAAVQVRMGLHAGEAQERGGDYFGLALNPCGPADVGSQWPRSWSRWRLGWSWCR